MKSIIKQLVSVLFLVMSVVMVSQSVQANEGYGAASIVSIDAKKKIIDFGDNKFKFDAKTIVYDIQGKKVDISDLKAGMTASVGIDPERRYVGFPTLKSLHLKSVIE